MILKGKEGALSTMIKTNSHASGKFFDSLIDEKELTYHVSEGFHLLSHSLTAKKKILISS